MDVAEETLSDFYNQALYELINFNLYSIHSRK